MKKLSLAPAKSKEADTSGKVRPRRPAPGTVLGGLAMSGVAVASIPSSAGVLSGCYSTATGQLRLIDAEAGATCARNEKAVSWNQKGETGSSGATNVVVRRKIVNGVQGGLVGRVDCATGEKAVGGGFDARGNGGELIPFYSKPYPEEDGVVPTGWQVHIAVPDPTYPNGTGAIYVVCASP